MSVAHWSQVRVFLMAPAHYPSVDTGPVTACPALVTPSSPHKDLRISPSPPSSVFISRAPVSGHGEWRGHVFQYVGTWFPSFQGHPLISGAMPLESGAGFA